MKHWQIAFVVTFLTALALAEDFKTVTGKEYKDATITRIEGDGIMIRTKTGISKVYFFELPKDVQEKFRPAPAMPSPTQPISLEVKEHGPEKAKGGKVVVVGQSAGTLKIVIAGIVVLLLVVFLIVRRFF
jgi:hypothetical protein